MEQIFAPVCGRLFNVSRSAGRKVSVSVIFSVAISTREAEHLFFARFYVGPEQCRELFSAENYLLSARAAVSSVRNRVRTVDVWTMYSRCTLVMSVFADGIKLNVRKHQVRSIARVRPEAERKSNLDFVPVSRQPTTAEKTTASTTTFFISYTLSSMFYSAEGAGRSSRHRGRTLEASTRDRT